MIARPLLAISIILALGLALSACITDNFGRKQSIGAVVGAATGGYLGSMIGSGNTRLVTTAGGTVLGLLLGSEIGSSLDRVDRLYAAQTQQAALENHETGVTAHWFNPDSGNAGTVTPTATYRSGDRQYCREFQQTVTIDSKTEHVHGTACRQPDGAWRLAR